MITGTHPHAPVRRIPLAAGDAGIGQTVSVMHALVDRGAVDSRVREQALGIVRQAGVSSRDSAAEIAAIFWWVKTHMRFQKDVAGGEYVCTPEYLLRTMAGDCDDYVVLSGALLKSLGIPIRIVTIAADREEPGRLSHVYLEASSRGEWVPFDATQEQSYPGWEPPRYFRKKIFENPGLKPGLSGLGQDFASDLEALTPLVGATTQGVAQIVSAENQPQYDIIAPQGDTAFASLTAGGSGSTILLLGLGLVFVLMMVKK